MRQGLSLLGLTITVLFVAPLQAQVEERGPHRVPEFGRTIASTSDSAALVLNPANLAFSQGLDVRWTGSFLSEEQQVSAQGHAFGISSRLPLVGSIGLRFDALDPPEGAAIITRPYQWLTLGWAWRIGGGALGVTVQRLFGTPGDTESLWSTSIGYSHRPWDFLSVGAVAHDVTSRASGVRAPERAYGLGFAIRPFSDDRLEINLEGDYRASSGKWGARGVLGVNILDGARLNGEFRMNDLEQERSWTAFLGLQGLINNISGSTEYGFGAFVGDGFGSDSAPGFAASLASRRVRLPNAYDNADNYALRVRLESTPDPRTHVRLLRGMWSIKQEKAIDAVVLELRASPATTIARLQELRDAVFELRRAGKRVLCHLESGDAHALYLCAAANKTLINPTGAVHFTGLRVRHLYFASLLKQLGIKADIVRVGAHKSAPEAYSRRGSTEVSRADKIDFLQQYEMQFVNAISAGRQMSIEQTRRVLSNGPFTADQATDNNLLDGVAFDDQIDAEVRKLVGRAVPVLTDRRAPIAPRTFGRAGYIALVYVDGEIVDGRSSQTPLIGTKSVGSYTIADTLKALRKDPRAKGIVVRVESPGGSALASDVVWREVQLAAKAKPTVVSMGSVAASGGYYLSASATRIFANPMTITGSIGVFHGKADVSQLMRRVGVDVEVYKTTPHADGQSMFRPFTSDERERLQHSVNAFYDRFLERVSTGRNLKKADVDKVAQGRVWTGEQALEHGLVDELGGLRQALAYVKKRARLGDNPTIVELPRPPASLVSRLLGISGLSIKTEGLPTSLAVSSDSSDSATSTALASPSILPPEVKRIANALAPFVIHHSETPLARLPVDIQLAD